MTLMVHANGADIPAIGFGTWQLTGVECERAVDAALKAGYRHIDTAQAYDNESEVGKAVKGSHVPRDEIFITTKVWFDRARDGDLQRSVEESLERLGLDHVDLILLHWPNMEVPLDETMQALGDVAERGLARHIGVSNFTVDLLRAAARHAGRPIVANQVEYHPYLDQRPVLAECRRNGVAMTAYSPIARGRVFDDPVISEIADRHGKTPGQVAIRWLIQQDGVIAIPRSSNPDHIAANNDVHDFKLDMEEMNRISELAEPGGRMVDPEWAPEWDKAA
jgi:2,5-diketo-D-gluconate reductase B